MKKLLILLLVATTTPLLTMDKFGQKSAISGSNNHLQPVMLGKRVSFDLRKQKEKKANKPPHKQKFDCKAYHEGFEVFCKEFNYPLYDGEVLRSYSESDDDQPSNNNICAQIANLFNSFK